MNIFNKTALQSMKKSPTRTMITIIGVILSTAMITAVATFAVSLQSYAVAGAVVKYGGWHVQISDVDAGFIQQQSQDSRVASTAVFENIGYATFEGGQNPDKPYLFIAGFNKEAFDTLPINLLSGRLPENSGEILVPAHVAANGGVHFQIGDTLSLAVGSRMAGNEKLGQHIPYKPDEESFIPKAVKNYTVTGVYLRPAFEEYSAPGYTLITTGGGDATDSCSMLVTLINPRKVQTYINDAAGNHSYTLNDNVLRFMGLSDDTAFNMLLYSVGGVLTALIMIGSIFLIYNSFSISLNERTRQFGILASVGATTIQLRNSVLFEGLCIGAAAIPVGIAAGIGSIHAVLSLVSKNFQNIMYDTVPLTLTVSVPAIAAAAAVSMVTILISAYIPAKKAAGMPVMESIRQTGAVKIDAKTVKTPKLAERLYGLPGTLALKNFKRNKKRYRSIVFSLTLSVVLFVSARTFGMYLDQIANESVVEFDGNILFNTHDMKENEALQLYDILKTADGLTESTYQSILTYSCQVQTSSLTGDFWESYHHAAGLDKASETVELLLDIQFIEDHIYQNFIESLGLSPAEYIGQDAKMIVVGKQSGGTDMFTSPSMDFTFGAKPGEQTKTIHTTFVDTYPLDPPPAERSEVKGYAFMAVAPYRMKPQFDMLGAPERLGFTFWSDNPAQSTAKIQEMIEAAGITVSYNLYNVHGLLEQNRNILFIVNLFTAVFVIMISLIAVANVFNTISTNIKLRRRELAMLRSVGMSDGDFKKMMHFECAFYGMRTLLLGLPIAGIMAWLIYRGLVIGGADIVFMFPWASMAISVFSVFFIVFITTRYAVRKIKKENIIDALRDDIT